MKELEKVIENLENTILVLTEQLRALKRLAGKEDVEVGNPSLSVSNSVKEEIDRHRNMIKEQVEKSMSKINMDLPPNMLGKWGKK